MSKQRGIIKTKSQKPSFITASPWVKVQKEIRQDFELRQPLIQKLEQHFGRPICVYFTSFLSERGICDSDAEMLENVLSAEHKGGELLLIINSPGGQALAAERVVNVCRAYSSGEFSVLVPHMAKSAATMICFGADKIYMSKTAELGPVDPQVRYKDDQERLISMSAAEYIRVYERLMRRGTTGNVKRLEPILLQLQRFDARNIERLRSQQTLSEDMSVSLLKSQMMKGMSLSAIRRKIRLRPFPHLSTEEASLNAPYTAREET